MLEGTHDPLTGLPNRALVADRAALMLARARRSHFIVGAIFVDLDNFTQLNAACGPSVGDAVLQTIGERLRGVTRRGETVGRYCGDQFVVLVEGPAELPGFEALAGRLLDVVRRPFVWPVSGMPRGVTASIGLAVTGESSVEDLLRDADDALHQAKRSGHDHYVVFDGSTGGPPGARLG